MKRPDRYIRPFVSEDYEHVQALLNATGEFRPQDHSLKSFERTREHYGEDGVLVHLSRRMGERALWLVDGIARIAFNSPDGRVVIGDVRVASDRRRSGIASALVRAMINIVRLQSLGSQIEVLMDMNTQSGGMAPAFASLYKKQGFKEKYQAEGWVNHSPDLSDPEVLEKEAVDAFREIHGHLLRWGDKDLFTQEAMDINDRLVDESNSELNTVRIDYVVDDSTGAHMADMHVSHPHGTKVRRDRKVVHKIWSAIKTQNPERHEMLRLLELPVRNPDIDFYDTAGIYVVHNKESDTLTPFRFPKSYRRRSLDTFTPDKCGPIFEELVKGTYVIDERHKYDRRWHSELPRAYPWTS